MRFLNLLILVVVTAATVAAAWFVHTSSGSTGEGATYVGASPAELPDRVVPQLVARADEALRIEITQDGASIAVERPTADSADWGLADRHGYPVRRDLVRPLMVGLSSLTPVQKKTAMADNHRRLALWMPDPAAAKIVAEPPDPRDPRGLPRTPDQPTHVRVLGPDGVILADVILGKNDRWNGDRAIFVRHADEDQTWLASGSVDAPADRARWLERDIVKVERNDVSRVDVTRSNGERYALVPQVQPSPGTTPGRPPVTNFVVEDMPAGKKMTTPFMANSIASAMSYVGVLDVRLASDAVEGETGTAVFTTNEGLVVTVAVTREYPSEPAALLPGDGEDEAGVEPEPDPVWLAISAEGPGAEEINAKADGWLFRVSPSAFDNLQRPLDELIEDADEADGPAAGGRGASPASPAGRRGSGPSMPVDIGGFGRPASTPPPASGPSGTSGNEGGEGASAAGSGEGSGG